MPTVHTRAAVRLVVATSLAVLHGCAGPSTSAWTWTAILAPAPVHRARAALVLESRDCATHLGLVELFARPEIAVAVGSVTVLLRDGERGLARATDARLTAPVQVAVAVVPARLREQVRQLGAGPRVVLVGRDDVVLFTARAPTTPRELAALADALARIADHYVASELATARTRS